MYGAGEYGNGFGLDAFHTLVGVAETQPQVVIATVAPPAAQEGTQEEDESPDGLPDGDGSGGAEKTGAWPQRDKLDLVRLDAARQIQTGWVPSGFTFHEKLSGWKPEASKPRQSELWQAIMERDPSQKPKHWDVKKCVAWLMQSAAVPTATISPALGAPAPGAPARATTDKESDDDVVTRWSTSKMMRLLHVCLSDELFSEFLQRDKKLTRTQLDGKAKNSFWHSAAITFCDMSKTYDLIDFPGVESDRYANLKAGLLPTTYALTAEKAKKEFGDFRTLLTKIYTRFKQSGEGDDVDEEKTAQEMQEGVTKPHGADFWDFCQGNAVIDYAYRFLKKKDALQNATCLMPAGSSFNSTPGSTTMETNAAKPRQNKKRKGGPIHSDVLKELRRPVKLHKSRAEKQLELIQAQRQALKLEAGLRKLAGQLREEETKLQREIRQADPGLVQLLQARLIPIQKRLVSLHAQLDTVPMPSAADVDDDDDSEDNGSDEKENGRRNEDAEEDEDEDEGEDADEDAA